MDWFLKLARVDPSNAEAWRTILTPKDLGLLLKSIRTDFKFVSVVILALALSSFPLTAGPAYEISGSRFNIS